MAPPVGVAMYTVCGLLETDIGDYVWESVPFVVAVVALVAVFFFFPGLVLFIRHTVF
jgi:TRAP-type transport system large permease protein